MDNISIREVKKSDKSHILFLFDSISKEDRKFLALNKKLDVIRQNISQERHIYVAEDKNSGKIIGYMRESGRPNNFVLLEEIAVSDDMRGKGIGPMLLKHLLNKYPKILAKTFSNNDKIINLLKKFNFTIDNKSPNGEILNWKHE